MLENIKGVSYKKYLPWLLFALQSVIIIVVGIFADVLWAENKNNWYKILISLSGLCFNFLTCQGMRWGFIAGAVYALSSAVMNYFEALYASAVFMLIIQLPMAIYTFATWKKAQQKEKKQLKKMTKKQIIAAIIAFPVSIVAICFILIAVNGNGAILDAVFDSLFFSMTLMSCILLAVYYRSAYLFVCLSGFSGIALWLFKVIADGTGASLLTLYVFVFINSLSAIKAQYFNKKRGSIDASDTLDIIELPQQSQAAEIAATEISDKEII